MRPLLAIEDLHVEFRTRRGVVHAVNGVDLTLEPGETVGLVGESGSGKSVTALAVLGLLARPAARVTAGRVLLDGTDLLALPEGDLRRVRGRQVAMVFQDPMTSLNPVMTVGDQLIETLQAHVLPDRRAALERAEELLGVVGVPAPAERLGSYPHQLSGGLRQRVMIAIAIACEPRLLIADEPTTALDVTIQAQILDLLRRLVAERDMALLLITHDLGVVAGTCRRTEVMYGGRIMERGSTSTLFALPRHHYTRGLLASVPRMGGTRRTPLRVIEGRPPTLTRPLVGCPFTPRCPAALERCHDDDPPLAPLPEDEPAHRTACWNPAVAVTA